MISNMPVTRIPYDKAIAAVNGILSTNNFYEMIKYLKIINQDLNGAVKSIIAKALNDTYTLYGPAISKFKSEILKERLRLEELKELFGILKRTIR